MLARGGLGRHLEDGFDPFERLEGSDRVLEEGNKMESRKLADEELFERFVNQVAVHFIGVVWGTYPDVRHRNVHEKGWRGS
jgi:hypothetical protein